MRIVSLVPSATEMLFALGLGDDVVAVTHECDYPPEATTLPRVTRDKLPAGLTPAQIDAAVKERTLNGESIYELDTEAAARAAARPDRHAGTVPGLRRLLRRRAGYRRGDRQPADGDRAGPAHGRRGSGRCPNDRTGDRHQGRGRRPDPRGLRADRPHPPGGARRPAGPAWSHSSGSTRRTPPATGRRS